MTSPRVGVRERLAEVLADWRGMFHARGLSSLGEIGRSALSLLGTRKDFHLVRTDLTPPPLMPDDVTCRLFDHRDVETVSRLHSPTEGALCRRRLELGHRGVVAEIGGAFAGYTFQSTIVDPAAERFTFDLEPGEVWIGENWVADSFRGRGVIRSLKNARNRMLRASDEEGWDLSVVEVGNRAALRGNLGMGSAFVVGELRYRRVLNVRRSKLVRWAEPVPMAEMLE